MAEYIQKDYEELKKKSELTEKFIRLANQLDLDEKDIPKTEKGMETKVKELIERLEKKLEKEENNLKGDGKRKRRRLGRIKKPLEDETHYWDGKRRRLRKRKK